MVDKRIIKVEDIRNEAESAVCAVEKALHYISAFLDGPMCGRCFPCSMGSYEARLILNRIKDASGVEEDIFKLKRIALDMLDGSMCKKGKDTARYLIEWLDSDVIQRHIEGVCPERVCRAFIEYRIIPDKCTLCGICKEVCKYHAIHGEKVRPFSSGYQPFEIRQKKCVKCGDCIGVCPENAIILLDINEPAVSVKG
jgi:NAD-dependent dihydropyrimidine dehydrogenase PreA subunit